MDKLSIWQQNINKSPTCQHDIISNKRLVTKGINIIALQEPAISKSWNQLEFPSSNVTATQITEPWGKLTIFNVYNDRERDDTISLLIDYHCRHRETLEHATTGEVHILWIGDINR